jgi:CRISPR-associated protein Csb2
MPLTITVRLRNGRYDAGGDRASVPEWPPHPARLFCALAASCDGGGDPAWAALRWLEGQPAPRIWADPAGQVRRGQASGYVVKNETDKEGGGSLTWPGRGNGKRVRAFAVPATDSFVVTWPEASPPARVLAQMAGLARLVPYVGRSTSLADVTVSDSSHAGRDGQAAYEPVLPGEPRDAVRVRVPYPGYVDELQAAYQDDRRAWEVARSVPYATARQPGDAQPGVPGVSGDLAPGPFEELLVWRLQRSAARVSGGQVAMLTGTLRRAVLSVVPDPVPAQVSGHGAPDRRHVGFLALPDVGHEYADGHVLGLALAIPRDLPRDDLSVLLRAVIPLGEVHLPGGRALRLAYGPGDLKGLRPERWDGEPGAGSREWVTATPIMLDGYLRRGQRSEASEVARSMVIAGYPRPVAVDVSPSPMLRGAVSQPRPETLPTNRAHRRLVHARVTFPVPVTGPVLAGSMRYLGVGLFLPVSPPSRQLAAAGQQEARR